MYWTVHLEGGPRRVNHAAVAVGDLIYSFGGYNTGEYYNELIPMDVHVLSTANLRWRRLPSFTPAEYQQSDQTIPFQRYGHTAVAYGKKIYIWGGRNEVNACNQIFIFDTETLTWSRPKAFGMVPVARDGHTACVINHRMYIFGGFEEEIDRFSNDVYYLDLATLKWHYVATWGEVAKYRDFHSASAIGSRMYVFGGRGDLYGPYGSHNEEYCSNIIYFDAESNRWHKPVTTGDIPKGRRSHASFIVDGMLYIFGGYNGITEEHFNDLHRFNPKTCEWKKIRPHGKPPIKRRRHSCIPINNKVYIFGGTSPVQEDSDLVQSVLDQVPSFHFNNQDENMVEENDNDVNLVNDQLHVPAIIPLGHDNNADHDDANAHGLGNVHFPFHIPDHFHDHALVLDDQNQNEGANQDDMDSDDDDFSLAVDTKLKDLNDLHILDLSPSLYTLCMKTVCDYRIDLSSAPEIIRNELHYFTTPNNISQ